MIRILDLPPAGCRLSPKADYPAAHSMDSCWFAVDDAGHVAMFWTGENGPLPAGAGEDDLLTDLAGIILGADEADRLDDIDTAQVLDVYLYEYDHVVLPNGTVDRYRRVVDQNSMTPRHVDQLPPELRARWKQLRLPGVRFANFEFIQPYEFFRCQPWDEEAAAYLTGDGKTLCAIPGREEEFRTLVADWREQTPDEIVNLRIMEPKNGR